MLTVHAGVQKSATHTSLNVSAVVHLFGEFDKPIVHYDRTTENTIARYHPSFHSTIFTPENSTSTVSMASFTLAATSMFSG